LQRELYDESADAVAAAEGQADSMANDPRAIAGGASLERPGSTVMAPKGSAHLTAEIRKPSVRSPILDPMEARTISAQESGAPSVDSMVKKGVQMVGDFARGVVNQAQAAGRSASDADRKAAEVAVDPMQGIPPERREKARELFNRFWDQDEGGGFRATYRDRDKDFETYLQDQIAEGVAPGQVGSDLAAALDRGPAELEVTPSKRKPLSAKEKAEQARSPEQWNPQGREFDPKRHQQNPNAISMPEGVTKPRFQQHVMAGGEDGRGQNVLLGPGMRSDGPAQEDFEDGQLPSNNVLEWANFFRQNTGTMSDQELRATVYHAAQQMGFDLTGVPEEQRFSTAKRLLAENFFRYGDPEMKEWVSTGVDDPAWNSTLQGDRFHISRDRDDNPLASGPMRESVWVRDPDHPEGGYYKDRATAEAKQKRNRLERIASTRETVGRRATLGPDAQMTAEDIAADMGQENWDSLTPAQQRKFTGEMERGARVFGNNVNAARNREIRAGTDRSRGWYNDEMAQAQTPLESFKVAMKYGDAQAAEAYAQMIAGDQAVAQAAAGARPGEMTPEQAVRATGNLVDESIANGDIAGALSTASMDGTNQDPEQTVASKQVQQYLKTDGATAEGLVMSPGMVPYLRKRAGEHSSSFGPIPRSVIGGGANIKTPEQQAQAFADQVIAELGLQQLPGISDALAAYWRGHYGFKDAPAAAAPRPASPLPAPPQAAGTQAPGSTGAGAVTAPGAPPTRNGSVSF
jgi:hypothetical protein